ncbi:MAG: hypothetical protein ACKV22_22960 [Bryobacteraceae bacterium]
MSEPTANNTTNGFSIDVQADATDDNGNPLKVAQKLTNVPPEAAEKPFMGGEQETHTVNKSAVSLSTNYLGISPEQEMAIRGRTVTGAASQPGPAGSEVTPGREVPPAGAASPHGSPSAAPPSTDAPAVPTGLSSTLKDLPQKIGEQIREQLKDVQGFSVTITRQTDGSIKIDGDIKRSVGAVPTAATSSEEPSSGTTVSGETATREREVTHHAVSDAVRPAVLHLSVNSGTATPSAEDADNTSSNVSSGASASVRNQGLAVTKLACVEGLAISVNVSLFNLTVA